MDEIFAAEEITPSRISVVACIPWTPPQVLASAARLPEGLEGGVRSAMRAAFLALQVTRNF